jgi:4-coumarate--CoA ligase
VFCSSGQPAAAALFYGIIAAGGVLSAASPSYTPEELARQITQGHSNLLVVSGDKEDLGRRAAQIAGLPLSRVVIMNSEPSWEVRTLDGRSLDAVDGPRLTWRRITDEEELKRSLIVLLYSSGTTGVPKGRCSYIHFVGSAKVDLPRGHALKLQSRLPTLHSLSPGTRTRRRSC